MRWITLLLLVESALCWRWTKPRHPYDKECPDVIWQQYFRGGKYEAAWWGHNVKLHPEAIQNYNFGRDPIYTGW